MSHCLLYDLANHISLFFKTYDISNTIYIHYFLCLCISKLDYWWCAIFSFYPCILVLFLSSSFLFIVLEIMSVSRYIKWVDESGLDLWFCLSAPSARDPTSSAERLCLLQTEAAGPPAGRRHHMSEGTAQVLLSRYLMWYLALACVLISKIIKQPVTVGSYF